VAKKDIVVIGASAGGNTAAAEKCFDEAREVHERVAAVREAALESEDVDVEKLRAKAAGLGRPVT
jgi:hypothetical protein